MVARALTGVRVRDNDLRYRRVMYDGLRLAPYIPMLVRLCFQLASRPERIMSRYPGHDPPHDPSSFSVDPYGAPTTYYDQQGVDLISKSSTDEKKDYYEEEVVEKPEVKVSRLDKFAGQTKSWGDLSNIDPEVVERVFDQDRVREAFTSRQLAMIALSGSVGVGIWLGVGKALAKAGPLSLLLGYLIVGVFACSMLFCQAEVRTVSCSDPDSRGLLVGYRNLMTWCCECDTSSQA